MDPRRVYPSIVTRFLRARGGFEIWLAEIIGAIPVHSLRGLAYRHILRMDLSSQAVVYRKPEIRAPRRISVGPGTSIGKNAILDGRMGLKIGKNVNLSSDVAIWTLQHDLNSESFGTAGGPVLVGDYVWLSFRSVILPGVSIGEGAVVAAGSVVTRDVAPYTVVAGIPAKQIGTRPRTLSYTPGGSAVPFL